MDGYLIKKLSNLNFLYISSDQKLFINYFIRFAHNFYQNQGINMCFLNFIIIKIKWKHTKKNSPIPAIKAPKSALNAPMISLVRNAEVFASFQRAS